MRFCERRAKASAMQVAVTAAGVCQSLFCCLLRTANAMDELDSREGRSQNAKRLFGREPLAQRSWSLYLLPYGLALWWSLYIRRFREFLGPQKHCIAMTWPQSGRPSLARVWSGGIVGMHHSRLPRSTRILSRTFFPIFFRGAFAIHTVWHTASAVAVSQG